MGSEMCIRDSPITSYVYVDDYNTIEKIRLDGAVAHVTTEKQKLKIRAIKSELQFARVSKLAQEINMRVNGKKTQVLCIHANKSSDISSFIKDGESEICSESKLKILGFYFDSEPTAVRHVTETIGKFYSKLWTLRFLKRSGMAQEDILCLLYTSPSPRDLSTSRMPSSA